MGGELVAMLRRDAAFTCLSQAELAMLTAGARRTVVRAGELIYRQGDPAGGFYVVESGRVRIVKGLATDGTGGHELRQLGPGAVFGVLDVLEESEREVSAIAAGRATILAVNRVEFDRVLAASPAIAIAIAQSLVGESPRESDRGDRTRAGPVH